ncbi:hypothetical protein [Carboxydothermus ferrireducens]|uniref:Uncharacterized protein n=1 Tax=Carboxydothermus ferrireducens DSM 11255 TaxID=1119529 RepID=A0ABX2RB91_9THEO|nr:hypothetical protein [Carboxydothermus ferrireducens]NYE57132.1 hypothetical protein [Carboxydothermus ferrireducens DSM 11255]
MNSLDLLFSLSVGFIATELVMAVTGAVILLAVLFFGGDMSE